MANVLVLYSDKDTTMFDYFNTQLQSTQIQHSIKTIQNIEPGDNILNSLNKEVSNADVIIGLISPDFQSDDLLLKTIKKAIQLSRKYIFILCIRSVDLHNYDVGSENVVYFPENRRPFINGQRDQFFSDVAVRVNFVDHFLKAEKSILLQKYHQAIQYCENAIVKRFGSFDELKQLYKTAFREHIISLHRDKIEKKNKDKFTDKFSMLEDSYKHKLAINVQNTSNKIKKYRVIIIVLIIVSFFLILNQKPQYGSIPDIPVNSSGLFFESKLKTQKVLPIYESTKFENLNNKVNYSYKTKLRYVEDITLDLNLLLRFISPESKILTNNENGFTKKYKVNSLNLTSQYTLIDLVSIDVKQGEFYYENINKTTFFIEGEYRVELWLENPELNTFHLIAVDEFYLQ